MTDESTRLIYARELPSHEPSRQQPSRQQHARRAARGDEVRVSRGVYMAAAPWTALGPTDRYRALVTAVAETRRNRPVLSHWSAAAVLGLPVVGGWPPTVHTIVGGASGGRSRNSVVAHCVALDDADVVEIDGLLVTSVARTVLDMAICDSFMSSVVLADAALHVDRWKGRAPLVTKDELWELWQSRVPFRGHGMARRVIDFAVTLADSPIESVSRVSMRVVGCPRPELQTRHSDGEGVIGEVDFDWPEFGLIGEADGDLKYLDRGNRGWRTAEQVVLDERIREDRLRGLPRNLTRWRWSTAVRPSSLKAQLAACGLPMGLRR